MASQSNWIQRSKQWNISIPFTVYDVDQSSELGVVANISRQDFLVTGVIEIPVPSQQTLWIEIGESAPFRVVARSVWQKHDEYLGTYFTGFECLAIHPEDMRRLQSAVDPALARSLA